MNDNLESVEKIIKQSLYDIYKIYPCPRLDFKYGNNKNYPGDIILILFKLSKTINRPIKEIGENIGNYIKIHLKKDTIRFYLINGFLNIIYRKKYYIFLIKKMLNPNFYKIYLDSKKVLIEYSSPNANKPLHIGHIRNILLGDSLSRILNFIGNKTIRIQMINDRGIHICKSMIAWKKFGKGLTPISCNKKGDHFVGSYYNLFHKKYINKTSILDEARDMLKKWEFKDKKTIKIWKMMTKWVYDGFLKTYTKLGIQFDVTEYESQIYEFGKYIVKKGEKQGIFFKHSDGSIWINLEKEKLGKKLLLRSDDTSVYITQDIGTAIQRFKKYNIDNIIYIVGREQEDYFKILIKVLYYLGYKWIDKISHLSYEMVYLPEGIIKSREGKIIYADQIILDIINIVKKNFLVRKLILTNENLKYYCNKVGICALKYYFLQVDPKKKIIFNPEKSIDIKGKTGIYIQYTYSRIRSLETNFFKTCNNINNNIEFSYIKIEIHEKNIIKILKQYPFVLKQSAKQLNPSLLANYVYDVSKNFNNLYQNKKLINNKNYIINNIYMNIINITGNVIKYVMNLLGITMIDKM